MAYQTGVSSTLAQLVDSIKSFAATQGFTSGPEWADGANTITFIQKNGFFYFFTYSDTDFWLNTAEGSNGSGSAVSQPEACPDNCRVWPIAPPHVGYHLFSHGSRIHVAVELVTNVYQHFSLGEIEKNGNWEGGAYVTSNCWTHTHNWGDSRQSRIFHYVATNVNGNMGSGVGHIRCTYSLGLKTARFYYPSSSSANSGANAAIGSAWIFDSDLTSDGYSPNAFNGRAVLVPPMIDIAYDRVSSGNGGGWCQLGHIPDAASTNMRNINPKETVNGDWMVFPLCEKNGPNTTFRNTGNYGMAYQK